MHRTIRAILYVVAIAQAVVALLFIFQFAPVTRLWPLNYTNALTFIFIGSIFAAAAASTLWVLLAREDGAVRGILLDYLIILTPLTIFAFQLAPRNSEMLAFAIVSLITVVFAIFMLLHVRHIPIRDTRSVPRIVRWSFATFVVALTIVGTMLVLKRPNVLPWQITPEGSVFYGWMFLGAGVYFLYALLRPGWGNTAGQLVGFLAYDLVLIIPFIARLPNLPPQYLAGQIIYLAVIIYSGVLAVYYLFINPGTRIIGFDHSTLANDIAVEEALSTPPQV